MSRSPVYHTVTTLASGGSQAVILAAPYDALTRPTNDDLIHAGLTLWPQGAAWGSPDGTAVSLDSNLARFTRVLLSPFVWLYARAFDLCREASVSGVSELLSEWEIEYGLPDSCVDGIQSVAERLRALEAKVNSQAVIHPSDFIAVAASYSFEIEIEEPAMFECGFSECGGEHETGSIRQEAYWVVRILNYAIDYFRVGLSEVGQDALFTLGEAARLLCILRRLAPAWTTPIFWDDPDFVALSTDDGFSLVTDGGHSILIAN